MSDLLDTDPDHIWAGDDGAVLGWGEAARIDVGTGKDRYRRAGEALDDSPGEIAFASFTFDPEEAGSLVIIPENVTFLEKGSFDGAGTIPEPPPGDSRPELVEIIEDPAAWAKAFSLAMGGLRRGDVEKVVLSRIEVARFAAALRPSQLARCLIETQPGSYVFSVGGLVGSSPELLATLQERRVRSVSLAGSAWRNGASSASLHDEKVVREHEYAADSVANALADHCSSLSRGPRLEVEFADIAHLATTFDGVAVDGTTILDLIGGLHPTAAVAGTPTDAALTLIREVERHQRGRYAGPVGWFDGQGNGSFAIAIRCGLVDHEKVTLYAGAGLVAGSVEEAEFAETRVKFTPMERALGISPGI